MSVPRIAIICDFLTTMGGAENVVLAMHEAFPSAPIYTAIYNKDKLPAFRELDVRPSRLQKIPKKLRKSYKLFPTLAVGAMRALDLSTFDIIIASSYLHGHQITKSRPDQILIEYCHTPPRYYWSHYELYRHDPGYGKLNPFIRALMPLMIPHQRKLDLEAAKNIDVFIANSTETQRRIKKYYGRASTVIHPPVDTKRFTPARERGDYYVTLGRQLPNKRFDLAIEACTQLGLELHVFGDGPLHKKLVEIAGPTIHFHTDRLTDASDTAVEAALNSAKGFIFPSDEDFGIVAVEALASGTPVVGYKKAGTLDIIEDGVSGVLFDHQTRGDVIAAIEHLETTRFLPATLQRKATRFNKGLFLSKLQKVVSDQIR
ncbi:MAG TPA: glycosyltransferase [Candidatus Saccharimonadaceae bacterium]|nr:glycosyltransferase [Candidatus Saccharimonadaceae bacterium]